MAVVEGRAPGGTGPNQILEIAATLQADGTYALEVAPGQGSTIRSTAGGPAPGQAAKNYSGTATLSTSAATTIPLETVTTGRTYLITDIVITTTSAAAILAQILANGLQIFGSHINGTKGIEAPGLETQPSATAGQVVSLVIGQVAAAASVAYNIFGIEQ